LSENGFPLTRDLNGPSSVDKFMGAGKQLKYISDDLASPVFQRYSLKDLPDWKLFIANVDGQQAVAKGLLGEEGILGNCTISLAGVTETTRPKDGWRETWRNMKLIVEGSPGETIRTESETDERMGDFPVQQKIEVRLIKNVNEPNSPTFAISTGDWGPLWLIHKYQGERSKADAKVWQVEFPVGAPGATGAIRLKLKFERPLPELDRWAVK
jgi:hypothetical protein